MANAQIISELAANAAADAVCAMLDDGYLEIYSRDGQLLTEARFGTRAFKSAKAGVAEANTISPALVDVAGIAGTFKAKTKQREDVFGGSVGTAGTDLILDETKLFQGDEITITALNYQQRLK